jgi:energy-coupling factor transport system permease protein
VNGRAAAAWSASGLACAFLVQDPVGRCLVLVAVAAVAVAAGGRRIRGLAPALAAASGFTALLNFGAAHLGATALFALPAGWPVIGGPYTLEALTYGAAAGLTLAAAVLAVAPIALLEPDRLLEALPPFMARTGAALSASLNLVPAVARTARAVADAQRFRGWRPGLRSLPEVVVPVVLGAIEDSIQLAESMEARGYGQGPRTSYAAAGWHRADTATALCALVSLAAVVALRLSGALPAWQPYPLLTLPAPGPLTVGALLLLGAPAIWWRSRA